MPMSQTSTIGRIDMTLTCHLGEQQASKPMAAPCVRRVGSMGDRAAFPPIIAEKEGTMTPEAINVTIPGHEHICPYCGVGIYCDDLKQRGANCELDADYICATCEVLTLREGQERILADNRALNARLADLNAIATKYQADLANRAKAIESLTKLLYDAMGNTQLRSFLSEHKVYLDALIRAAVSHLSC